MKNAKDRLAFPKFDHKLDWSAPKSIGRWNSCPEPR